eukprot:CAMPEP_0196805864 /NCGR_PEP_ID=MMETSP1362-20130617/5698_1 /TAXON_ID=163516 /ORGANISM="Leptocylindrus danicus, Strain CCMP1856" /LENGTH=153 /DNA_ID=CAMNT_0042179035 /DNA_START=1524 /DNA_END=1985 /DNA_ORIENTATION=-
MNQAELLILKKWGDFLFRIDSKADEAIEHYMAAHAYIHVFEAALKCKRLSLASSLINELGCKGAHPAYMKLGHNFARAGNFNEAENYFHEGNQPLNAINLYIKAGIWDKVDILARKYLSEDELDVFSRRFTDYLEGSGHLNRAKQTLLSNHAV